MMPFRLRNVLPKSKVFYSTSKLQRNENSNLSLIQRLSEEFSEAKPLISKLKKYDQMNIHFDEWKSRIDLMKGFGFSDFECFKMIAQYPSIVEMPLLQFEGSIQQWYAALMGEEYYKSVLLSQPILFEAKEDDISRRIPHLRVYFNSSKNLSRLLINSPDVMYDDWQAVVMKIYYLLQERRFTAGEISLCPALSKPLDFIKFRFDLLEKCGIYKQSTVPIHKVNKYSRSEHVNPCLKDILITSCKQFSKVAKITEEEYEVYKSIYMMNEDDTSDYESDSDE